MKFRHLVFLFIALVIIVAWLTKPDLEDFKEFYAKESKGISGPPLIDEENSFVYSRFNVSHYIKVDAAGANNIEKPIAVPAKKSVYLGLFGRFWNMD